MQAFDYSTAGENIFVHQYESRDWEIRCCSYQGAFRFGLRALGYKNDSAKGERRQGATRKDSSSLSISLSRSFFLLLRQRESSNNNRGDFYVAPVVTPAGVPQVRPPKDLEAATQRMCNIRVLRLPPPRTLFLHSTPQKHRRTHSLGRALQSRKIHRAFCNRIQTSASHKGKIKSSSNSSNNNNNGLLVSLCDCRVLCCVVTILIRKG